MQRDVQEQRGNHAPLRTALLGGSEPLARLVIEYLKCPPSRALLKSLVARMGVSVRDVVRVKGTPYHDLGLDDPTVTDDQLLDAMIAHPILINRLIVVTPLGVKLCQPSEIVLDLLPGPQLGEFRKRTVNWWSIVPGIGFHNRVAARRWSGNAKGKAAPKGGREYD